MSYGYNIWQVILNCELQDLTPLMAGAAEAHRLNFRPPQIYNYMLLHYVLSGKGTFTIGDKTYPVCAGQAFLITPGAVASFQPSQEDPWALRWIGFGGSLSHHFSLLPPVFDAPQEIASCFSNTFDPNLSHNVLSCYLSSELLFLHAKMLEPSDNKRNYIQPVIDHIQSHYMEQITVEDIAAKLGLTRSYLTDIFRKKMGKTIRAYIIESRILAAKQHLMDGSSVKQAALLSGFNDVSYFIKIFIRKTGHTPTAWMKKTQNDLKHVTENIKKRPS